MSEEFLVRHCSPTLAGLKTGNLFIVSYENEEVMRQNLRHWNHRLTGKGVRFLPLRFRNGKALVYVYRPARLHQDLRHQTACRILSERGYNAENPAHCITLLRNRLRNQEEFPHEIGLFLGYPPEDVSGFIENKAASCKCVGCWKVYGDAEAAQRTFARYKKCTEIYCRQHAVGRSIDRLTVAD